MCVSACELGIIEDRGWRRLHKHQPLDLWERVTIATIIPIAEYDNTYSVTSLLGIVWDRHRCPH